MLHVAFLALAAFIAAYGNAMRKVTWKRRLAAQEGKQTAGTTKAYDVTGLVVLNTGILALAAWAVWIGIGNPIEFIRTTF